MEFLNYHHLRLFWMVAREGSVRQAAERLHLSPPTISAQISALEDSIGEKLFRRAGRGLQLTDAGRLAFEAASEIFPLGQEMLERLRVRNPARRLRMTVGIVDSLPKLLSWEAIAPVFQMAQPVHVTCREGPAEDLLTQLAVNRLDVVLADSPAPVLAGIRAFSHRLGECGTEFCAPPALAAGLQEKFPHSLTNVPVILPLANTAWRQALDSWFHARQIQPLVIAEFEDAALMKVAGAAGLGIVPVPERSLDHARDQHGFVRIGSAPECRLAWYAITAQRRVTHPGVAVLTGTAGAA